VSGLENFYDVLFELSNEDRHRILLQLDREATNVTQLAKKLGLSLPETSRHVARLGEVGLTQKDVKGFYRLTPYGDLVLRQLREVEFTSQHRAYFTSHSLSHLPLEFVKRIGDLADSTYTDNVMDFLHGIENIIKEAEEHIWFQVDQYPVSALALIGDALDRGVRFRCIEPEEGVSGPRLSIHKPEEISGLRRVRSTPLVEQRTLESVDVFLFLSEKRCALAFPTPEGKFDYQGFTTEDERSLKWCGDLFQHYWETAEPKVYISPTEYVRPTRLRVPEEETRGSIVVEGRDDSNVDAQAVQDAVDNYDEVILRGTFNFGTSTVIISRSVVVKGEGRKNDIPLTKVYKKGWTFPFTRIIETFVERYHVFLVDGEGADVTIENIHFTDFNYECLDGHQGNSMKIRNNRITLETGLGRGASFLPFGDYIIGIAQHSGFPGGVVIEGNYLDYALSYARRVPLGPTEDPKYRPDLRNHEYYIGVGILVKHACGKVIIANNVVRNMNAYAIVASENMASADVIIRNNTIVSGVYGSYPREVGARARERWAGFGILAQTSGPHLRPGFYVEITDNTIKYDKINYCGILLRGSDDAPEGSGKLSEGIVKNNRIRLENGSIGILAESCDTFEITENTVSGKVYYGIGIFPRADPQRTDLGAHENVIKDNDMKNLKIKKPDEYSKGLFDDRTYADSKGGTATAHVWLNPNTKGNIIKVRNSEVVVDEGTDNTIIFDKNEA